MPSLAQCLPTPPHGHPALAPGTRLGDQLVVVGQVGSAVDTAVCPVAVWQIRLESFGFGQLHHLGGALHT